MTQFRIDVKRLPEEIDEVLAHAAAGDEVLIERDGSVVGEFQPRPRPDLPKGSLAGFILARRKSPPIDDDFVKAVEEAVAAGNQPAEPSRWES